MPVTAHLGEWAVASFSPVFDDRAQQTSKARIVHDLYEVPFTPNEGHGFRTLSALGFEEFPQILVHFYGRPASKKGSLAWRCQHVHV
jgi:hypothetical protein